MPAHRHLREDAPHGPHVDGGRVVAGAEEDLRSAVPERDDLVRVGAHGDAEGAREAEVGELEVVIRIDQQILRLEVAMQDAVRVAIEQPGRQLVGKFLSRDLARRALVTLNPHRGSPRRYDVT